MGIPTTNTGNLEQRRLLYQKYGYDINKLIRTHEKHESRNQHEDGVNNDGFIILNAKSDKLDYQRLFEASNKDIYASNNVSHKNNKSKRRGNNDQGFRKFTKVSTSFRKLEEESAKRSQETSWVLKDVLKYIKYRSQRLDPFITKWFTPKGRSISELGIEPDYKVEITEEYKAKGELEGGKPGKDPQLDKAIELLK